jgi:hypothetical protein
MGKIKGRERWFKTSEGRRYHRCAICWADRKDGAYNNGWAPEDQRYRHAPWCPNRGKF